MKHDARGSATELTVGGEQAPDVCGQIACLGQRVGHRAGGTGGRANAAALAKVRIDLHRIAERKNGFGGAGIDAAAATLEPFLTVRTNAAVQVEELRLFERTAQLDELLERLFQCLRVVAYVEIAQRRHLLAHARRVGQIQHQVGPGFRSGPQLGKAQGQPVAENAYLELAQPAADLGLATRDDRVVPELLDLRRPRAGRENHTGKVSGHPGGRLQRSLSFTNDQQATGGAELHYGGRGDLQVGQCTQGRSAGLVVGGACRRHRGPRFIDSPRSRGSEARPHLCRHEIS